MPLFDKTGGTSTQKAARASKILAGLATKESDLEPQPDPQPKPDPQPDPQPQPDPKPKPKPEPKPDPQPDPEPKPEPNDNPDPQPEPRQFSDNDLLSALSEKLGKKLNSLEELTAPKEPELPADIKQLLDWSKETGLPVAKWPEYNQDFGKLSDLDVATRVLSEKYPNFTKEELAYKMKDFVFDPEVDEESDKIAKSIRLKEFAANGRQELEKNRLSLIESAQQKVLSPEVQEAIKIAEQVKAEEASKAQSNQQYLQSVTEATKALNAIDLTLTDDLKIQFALAPEVKNSLPKMVAEMPHWYNADGSLNHSAVVKDVAKATQFDAAVKAAFEQGVHYGKEGVIKKNNNVTIDRTVPQIDGDGSKKKGNVKDVVGKLAGGQDRKLRFRRAK